MPQNHFDEDTLEQRALGRLGGPTLAAVEEHLLVCEQCRDRLTEIERFIAAFRGAVRGFATAPLDYTHQTELGPIRLGAFPKEDQWEALISGSTIEYGRTCDTVQEANRFLLQGFEELFPGHRCTEQCGPTEPPA